MEQKTFELKASPTRERIVGIARRYGLTADEAEDVAQEVMLRLWALHHRLNEESMQALATVAARNQCIDRLRSRKTIPLDADIICEEERRIEATDELAWLENRMRQLPGTEYQVLRLRQVEGRPAAEIARLLGIAESSVPVLLSRARRNLLKKIKEKRR